MYRDSLEHKQMFLAGFRVWAGGGGVSAFKGVTDGYGF